VLAEGETGDEKTPPPSGPVVDVVAIASTDESTAPVPPERELSDSLGGAIFISSLAISSRIVRLRRFVWAYLCK